jgi:uncharacterized protein (DUF4415 family)
MNANKNALGSNLAQVDVHSIGADEYDEIPELTDADMLRGEWKIGERVVSETQGRAAFASALKKQKINITLDPDVVAWFKQQAGGRGYQTLINASLREAMRGQQIEETLRRVIREELRTD